MKEIVILGGPNGAGKTTAAKKLLPRFPAVQEFLNADEFARAISPNDVERAAFAAGRKMLERMQELIVAGISFGLESTLSGRSYVRILKDCKRHGWRITMLYLWLPRPEDAVERVARRVQEGGHGVAPDVVRRRYLPVYQISSGSTCHWQTNSRYTIIPSRGRKSRIDARVA